jgi:hypothetical protein
LALASAEDALGPLGLADTGPNPLIHPPTFSTRQTWLPRVYRISLPSPSSTFYNEHTDISEQHADEQLAPTGALKWIIVRHWDIIRARLDLGKQISEHFGV